MEQSVASVPQEAAAPQLYTRRSSGLVREMSGTAALMGSICIINLPIAAVTLMLLPFTFPGASMPLSVLLSLVPAVILGSVYVLFGIMMPRSGGDYVFNGRALHPAVGFAANFNFVVWNLLFAGIEGSWISTVGLSGLFASIGSLTGNTWWNTAAVNISKHWVAFGIGTIALLIVAILLTNTVRALRVMKITFSIGITAVVITVIWTLFISHGTFVHNINHVSSYSGIIANAHKEGFVQPHSWHAFSPTISGVALVSLVTLFVMFATYTGGEVKNVRRSIPISIYGSLAIGGLIFTLMAFAAVHTMSPQFVASTQALNGTSAYPFSSEPTFNLIASLGSGSTVFAVIINVGFIMLMVANMIFTQMAMTRCIFAWSMDRVTPSQVAQVSPRTHAPNWAIAIGTVGALIGLAVFVYTSFSKFLGGTTLGFLFTFLVTGLAAVVFPYRRKELYEKSPVKPTVFGVPLLSILGALSMLGVGAIAYAYFSNSAYGSNTTRAYSVFLGAWIVGFIYYAIARFVRKRQGVDLGLAATTLPPD
ncbi:MAG TPA: APC family permease [Solirubrobacteraceae bacterium]|jgi:amino acid transporter